MGVDTKFVENGSDAVKRHINNTSINNNKRS